MASKLPEIQLSTQASPYWEIPLYDADGKPLSIEGRVFEAWIAPASVRQGVGAGAEAIKVLTLADGLAIVPPKDNSGSTVKNTFVHRISKEFAQSNLPRGVLTADILEVVDGSRRLFIPVRLNYDDPAAIRDFVPDAVGVSFGASRQPIVTSVAIAGREGARGSGFLTGQGLPSAAEGEDGDYWINAAADPRMIYGPKAAGAWPADGEPIVSKLTPALQAARDEALQAAAGAQAGAAAVAADRQAVDTGAAQVESARRIVVSAQALVSQDATATVAAREIAIAQAAAAHTRATDAAIAAANAQAYAAQIGRAALDFNFDSDPAPTNDWNS